MIQEILSLLENMNRDLPVSINLTDTGSLSKVTEIADKIIESASLYVEIEEVEKTISGRKDDYSFIIHLAIKLAKSKKALQTIKKKIHLSVVFAIYKEHQRILTSGEHPFGEDFLMKKIEQLNWLFDGKPNFSWDMIVVDDGCPENSGQIAKKILKERYDKDNVKVLFLKDAIEKRVSFVNQIRNTDESRKGGSIEYGMWVASREEKDNHIIMYTDADLSIHLGQAGLLIEKIINEDKNAAIGSRREDTSVFIKHGIRNTRGKLFIYLWKRLLSPINFIVDTQCGFKAFTADNVRKILPGTIEKQFAFDIELLLKTEILKHNSISKVAIAGIDSVEASTTTDLQPYLDMLKMIANMYYKYLPENGEAEEFAGFIESLNREKWDKLIENIPEAIAEGEPAEFDSFNKIGVKDLQAIIEK